MHTTEVLQALNAIARSTFVSRCTICSILMLLSFACKLVLHALMYILP